MTGVELTQMKRTDFESYFWSCMDSADVPPKDIDNLITEMKRRNKIEYADDYLCDARDGYHVDEMVDAIIKYGDFRTAADCVVKVYQNNYAPHRFGELFDLFISSTLLLPKFEWLCKFNYSGNYKIKLQLVEGDNVDVFRRYVIEPTRAGLYADIRSIEDFYGRFYHDVPDEIRLGILV